eukprot:NODE_2260_length_1165_cov_8.481183_g1873_i0.p1 GENE.NODE_2260_length_1165_cov_8.481183_g1873_i0~~NODE_2260_length_1165_cov_8.481183_g1873_i0.p1  ORF type:complete len:363 (+),score=96.05 NODE_2260_length_1165_cov_8.481183_g1873_i0:139-1089(+)
MFDDCDSDHEGETKKSGSWGTGKKKKAGGGGLSQEELDAKIAAAVAEVEAKLQKQKEEDKEKEREAHEKELKALRQQNEDLKKQMDDRCHLKKGHDSETNEAASQVGDLQRQVGNLNKHLDDLKKENQRLQNTIACSQDETSPREAMLTSHLNAAQDKITQMNALFAACEQKRRLEKEKTVQLEAEVDVLKMKIYLCPKCKCPVLPPTSKARQDCMSPSWVTRTEARVLESRLKEYITLKYRSESRRKLVKDTAAQLEQVGHHKLGFWSENLCERVRTWFSLNVNSGVGFEDSNIGVIPAEGSPPAGSPPLMRLTS